MVLQEIYILQKHANFPAPYIENLPTWKRRYHIHLLEKEVEELKKHHEAQAARARTQSRRR
jgi:hypothetical protein